MADMIEPEKPEVILVAHVLQIGLESRILDQHVLTDNLSSA